MHHSGIHATIAGFYWHLPFPTNRKHYRNLAFRKLEKNYTYLFNYFIMPIFALANTNIQFKSGMIEDYLTISATELF